MVSKGAQNNLQVFCMLFFSLGVNQDVIYEHHDKLVEVFHEHLVHEVHKIGWCISQSEGHHSVLKKSITGGESGLGNVGLPNFELVVTSPEIYLGEDSSSIHLVK